MIKDSSHPIPVEMYNGFEAHGVKIVLEVKDQVALQCIVLCMDGQSLAIAISYYSSLEEYCDVNFSAHIPLSLCMQATIPSLSSEPSASDLDNLPHLDDIAQQILSAGTRLIYTYTYSPTDIYLYEEAI